MLSEIDFGAGAAPWYQQPSTDPDAPIIHFSAANGFPVASYKQFFNAFDNQLSFTGMDCRGAWPSRKPPQGNFSPLDFAQDLISAIETQHTQPIIGMGHSHGGLVTLIAAHLRPELFSKLVIIEAPSAPDNLFGRVFPYVPKWLLLKTVPFIRGSHNRRRIFNSRQEFYNRYHGHPTFKRFTDPALRDYAEHGLREREDGLFELRFLPEWESHIFCTVPIMAPYLRKVTQPTLAIRAEHSYLYTAKQFAHYGKTSGKNVSTITMPDAHHLVPHEDPEGIAKLIQNWLNG